MPAPSPISTITLFVLLLAAYLPGRIKAAVKHPMLVATKLWATAHLLANGNLADVLLFGGFLAWAVADRISMKQRVQRPLDRLGEERVGDRRRARPHRRTTRWRFAAADR